MSTTVQIAAPVSAMLPPTLALTTGFVLPEEAPLAAVAGPRAPRAAREGGAVGMSGMQIRQGFLIGDLGLMIRYDEGSELTAPESVYHIPNSPGWLRGMCNLHGMLVPVVDLAQFLGLKTAPDQRQMLLVLSRGADSTGVLIDDLPLRLRWGDEDRADVGAAPARLQPVLRDACMIDDKLWFDLEVKQLLDMLEQAIQGVA